MISKISHNWSHHFRSLGTTGRSMTDSEHLLTKPGESVELEMAWIWSIIWLTTDCTEIILVPCLYVAGCFQFNAKLKESYIHTSITYSNWQLVAQIEMLGYSVLGLSLRSEWLHGSDVLMIAFHECKFNAFWTIVRANVPIDYMNDSPALWFPLSAPLPESMS